MFALLILILVNFNNMCVGQFSFSEQIGYIFNFF